MTVSGDDLQRPSKMANHRSGRWLRVSIYYAIAIALSALHRFYWHTGDLSHGVEGLGAMYWHLVGGLGPFVGALVVWIAFRPPTMLSFGGSYPQIAWIMLAVPAVVMGAIGVANPYGLSPHLVGLHMGAWIALYAVLEETGWRGYLQGEFNDQSAVVRYSLVGVFWYAWHLSFLEVHALGDEIMTVVFMILASVGIGFVADRTKSILAAASFHVIGNIMGLTTDFSTLIPSSSRRLEIVGICVMIWLLLLRLWRSRSSRTIVATAR